MGKIWEFFDTLSEYVYVACNNDNLRPGTFLKWSYYHTGLQKFLYLIDTMIEEEGHRYRLEIAIDISEPKQANADSHYLSLEMLIN